jgi:hypothetical protein
MPRNRRHAISSNELYQEIGRYFDSKDISSIQRRFGRRDIDAKTAIKQFGSTSPQGVLWAGEIAVEEAVRAAKSKTATALFNQAEDLFIQADQMQQLHWHNRIDSIRARARINLAYLPVHKLVYLNELPPPNVAEAVYRQSVLTGHDLATEYRAKNPDVTKSDRHDINGTCANIGVLALWQRLPLRTGLRPDTFWPRPAYYSEEHSNTHGSFLSHSVDIAAMAKRESLIEIDYRLQVRASDFRKADFRPNEPGITSICVDPDLRLETDRFNVGCVIIDDCFNEMTQPQRRGFTRKLNQRLNMLQDLLDAGTLTSEPGLRVVTNPAVTAPADYDLSDN